ncbi:MAG: hypothetical protein Q4F97_05185 [Bacteroidales bacterium]|nr:hypothetical protein [Bacteroidales bacterium]
MKISLPDITLFLKIFGGISLLLVVLQGSMELKWSKEKNKTILKMFLMCILPMLTFSFLLAWFLNIKYETPFNTALINIIPFSIISSAIAIPAASLINDKNREEIVYESSFCDIIGIIFFDFVFQQRKNLFYQTEIFIAELIGIIILTILATVFIAWLLGFLKSKVRLIPIMAALVLVYEIAEYFALPGLIFIFVFGLFLGNMKKLSSIKFVSKIKPKQISGNTEEFYHIVTEIGFLTRSIFFLILGFYIKVTELLNLKSLLISAAILLFIYLIRAIYLFLLKVEIIPNIFYAPRGLVTILLFLYIPISFIMPQITISVVIQVVILSTLIMAVGPWIQNKNKPSVSEE